MSLTGFPILEKDLAQVVRECVLDVAALQTLVKACDLQRCRGMCCHDGVFLGAEEQAVIGELTRESPFDTVAGKTKTRTVAASPKQLGDQFPAHFPKTRCVFLTDNHFCQLQKRALTEGRHPWYWKPFPCWLHPLGFRQDRMRRHRVLSLPTPQKDPAATASYPGFASCTTCGRQDGEGQPAWQVLRAELAFLSEIGGRDLLSELQGHASPD